MTLLKINGLKKRFPGVDAVKGIDMEVPSGKIIGLLGPNMSGKTTLLKLIAGLYHADEGEITYLNGIKGMAARNTFSFLPDTMEFPRWMRVRDAFAFYKDMYPDYSDENAENLTKLLELPPERKIAKLSKGMKERVTLALTFARKTSLYLLDEPLGGVDPLGKAKIMEAILTAPPENASIMLSTHLVKDVETVFDSVLFISGGKIVYSCDCEEIREKQCKTMEQVYMEVFQNEKAI